jgi:SAM-dependent methyltransferase
MIDMATLQQAWEAAGRRGSDQSISPAGAHGRTAYDSSGRWSAYHLTEVFPPHPDLTLLEFGCGNGRVTQHLAGRYGHILAVDFADSMLEQMREMELPGVTPICWNGLDCREELYGRVDAAYSDSVLLHNTHADGATILANLARCVIPGGLLAIQLPVYEVPREPTSWIDVGCWTAQELRHAAAVAGCEVIALYPNPGAFEYGRIGPNHDRLHVLRRATCSTS